MKVDTTTNYNYISGLMAIMKKMRDNVFPKRYGEQDPLQIVGKG